MSGKRSGLGRNLSALLGTSSQTGLSSPPMMQIRSMPLDVLQPGKYQPRTLIDEASIQELADSIRQQGLLQPILIRGLHNGRYEIIAGERRWRACALAGLAEVPVLVHQVDDETTMAMALVENLQREDLNPIEEARAMARLAQEFTLTHQEIANLLSKSRAAVSNFLRLLNLVPDVLRLVEHGDLDMGHARALLALEEDKQLQVATLVVAQNLSVRETEKLVTRVKNEKLLPERADNMSCAPGIQAKIEELADRLQAKIKLKAGKAGKGALVIHFDSLQSLESLLFHKLFSTQS